jgi:hypothetical protein
MVICHIFACNFWLVALSGETMFLFMQFIIFGIVLTGLFGV